MPRKPGNPFQGSNHASAKKLAQTPLLISPLLNPKQKLAHLSFEPTKCDRTKIRGAKTSFFLPREMVADKADDEPFHRLAGVVNFDLHPVVEELREIDRNALDVFFLVLLLELHEDFFLFGCRSIDRHLFGDNWFSFCHNSIIFCKNTAQTYILHHSA